MARNNTQPPSSTAPRPKSPWGRLPLIGKMLVLFWGGMLILGGAFALTVQHFTAHIPPAPKPYAVPKPSAHLAAPATAQPPHRAAPVPPTSTPSTPTVQTPPAPPVAPLLAAQKSGHIPLAFILMGYGYNAELSLETLKTLPPAVAFGVSPYLPTTTDTITQAHKAKHELYMTLPMRSLDPDHTDTGAEALGTGSSPAVEEQKFAWWLTRTQNMTGMTDITSYGCAQVDNTYLQSQEFHDIAHSIERHGLLYMNGQTMPDRPTKGMTATLCLNGDTTADKLTHTLDIMAQSATVQHPVLVVMTPFTPTALHGLFAWLQSPAAASFTLVPPSALADAQTPLSTH